MKLERTKAYRKLKESITQNLKDRGLTDAVYLDKRDEYMNFWVHLKELEADIAERGVAVEDEKRGMKVENRSVSLSVQVSKQMLAILKSLGLSDLEKNMRPEEEDELCNTGRGFAIHNLCGKRHAESL